MQLRCLNTPTRYAYRLLTDHYTIGSNTTTI